MTSSTVNSHYELKDNRQLIINQFYTTVAKMKKLISLLVITICICNIYAQSIPLKTMSERWNNEEIVIKYSANSIVLEKKDFVFDKTLYQKEKEGSMSRYSTTFSHEQILPPIFFKSLDRSLMDSLIKEDYVGFNFVFYVRHNGSVCNLTLVITKSPITQTVPIQKWLTLYTELLKIRFEILKPGLDIPYYRNGFGYNINYFGQYISSK